MHPVAYPHPVVEEWMHLFKASVGMDYDKYRNHVYRVFFNCILLDSSGINEHKYAIAAVFHDIGIWTDHTINYLDPSVEQVRYHLQNMPQQQWIDEITAMILWHHKTTSYKGSYSHTVEIFRKADWIDVSLGFLNFGADRKALKKYNRFLPNRGFHLFLIKQICKNFLRHPLNPLPMFRL